MSITPIDLLRQLASLPELTSGNVAADDIIPIRDTDTKLVKYVQAQNALSALLRLATTGFVFPPTTPTQLTANTDNYSVGVGPFSKWTANADGYNVTGMVAGVNGEYRRVFNTGTKYWTLKHEVTSTAANRFTCQGAVDIVHGPNEIVDFYYDGTTSRWLVSKVRSNVSQGTLIVRQPGGVAGTDEVQFYHDGSNGYITAKDGTIRIPSTVLGNRLLEVMETDGTTVRLYITNKGIFARGAVFGFTATDVDYDTVLLGSSFTISPSVGGFIRGSSNSEICFNASTNNPNGSSADTVLSRAAAAVFRTSKTDGTLASWIQNTAGLSRVNADITNVTTTLATITGLSATVIAGRKYVGFIKLYVEDVTALDGLLLDFDGGTATWTSFRATYVIYDTLAVVPLTSGQTTAIANDISVPTLTGAAWVEIDFSGVCNAAGTFIPRFAKESDVAGAALTVRANSYMMMEDMP